jgi:hypothetical protein
MRDIGIPFTDPEGTYFVLADIAPYLKKGQTDVEFCEEMARRVGVACVPGTSFFKENINNALGTNVFSLFDNFGKLGSSTTKKATSGTTTGKTTTIDMSDFSDLYSL